MKQVAAALFAAWLMSILPVAADALPDSCRQCIVVTTPSWSATTGTLSTFERSNAEVGWSERKSQVRVAVGKNGLAWGLGVNDLFQTARPTKMEGDNKAPAGIFRLRNAFGYAREANTRLPYRQVTSESVCVDDSRSRHYNQLVNQSNDRDWRSAEVMRRSDIRYRWGVVVDHNPRARPGAGSCIFLHVWISPNEPTIGCTAMAEKDIVDLLRWLDPARAPLLVQLPRDVYNRYRDEWHLPPLR
jgi:zinc D-Ala-D-Ala dipeptidase